MSSDVSLAWATFPDDATARRVCTALVEARLIACANVLGPHDSIYRWEGRLEQTREVGAILKFATRDGEALARRFTELHPYDVPALTFIGVTGGAAEFLAWVAGK